MLNKENQLKSFPLFRDLPKSSFEYLLLNSRLNTQKKGEYLNCNSSYTYFLVQGIWKVSEITQDGEEVIKYLLRRGSFFNESEKTLVCSNEFATGLSSLPVVLTVPRAIIFELMGTSSHFAKHFNALALIKCGIVGNQLSTLVMKDTKQRLIRLIANLAYNDGIENGAGYKVRNFLTHREIASLIGATRVTVTKFLTELRASGDLDYSRKMITVFNQELLAGCGQKTVTMASLSKNK